MRDRALLVGSVIYAMLLLLVAGTSPPRWRPSRATITAFDRRSG